MFACPVCKLLIAFPSIKELSNHLRDHVSFATPFSYPLACCQPNCGNNFKSQKTFLQHVALKHHDEFVAVELESYPTEGDDSPDDFNCYFDADSDAANSAKDYNKHLTDMLLIMFKSINIPHSYIEEMFKSFKAFVKILQTNLIRIVQQFRIYARDEPVGRPDGFRNSETCPTKSPIYNHNISSLILEISEEVDCAVSALSEVNTSYKVKHKLYNHPFFVEQEAISLGSRWETHLSNGSGVNTTLVREECYYIPILKTIRGLLLSPMIAKEILEEKFHATRLLHKFQRRVTFFESCSFFRSIQNFSSYSVVL